MTCKYFLPFPALPFHFLNNVIQYKKSFKFYLALSLNFLKTIIFH